MPRMGTFERFTVDIKVVQDLPDDRLVVAYMEDHQAVARVREGHMSHALAWVKQEYDNCCLTQNMVWVRHLGTKRAVRFYYDTAPPEMMDGHLLIPFWQSNGDTVWVMDSRHVSPELVREYNDAIASVTPTSGIVRMDQLGKEDIDPNVYPRLPTPHPSP